MGHRHGETKPRSALRPIDQALGIHDLAVHLVGRQIDEFRRKIGDQRLKAQALFKLGRRVGVLCVHPGLSSAGRGQPAGRGGVNSSVPTQARFCCVMSGDFGTNSDMEISRSVRSWRAPTQRRNGLPPRPGKSCGGMGCRMQDDSSRWQAIGLRRDKTANGEITAHTTTADYRACHQNPLACPSNGQVFSSINSRRAPPRSCSMKLVV